MVTVGSRAPGFSLHRNRTDKVSLDDYRGKKVIVAFFPAAFTSVCQKELCTFRDSLADLSGLGAEVVAISVDSPFANAAFAEQHRLPFPVLSDYDRQATRAWGVELRDLAGLPGYVASQRAVFVVDREGIVRYAWVAPNPGVEPDYAAVRSAVAAIA
ncbi:MAG: peroxiredoxin [Myxococcota bacterium]|nr:peroxiredoxin [Myxococcota bacterium]MDW8363731.1 peroxiredoxin [Myxococcales bacterium]